MYPDPDLDQKFRAFLPNGTPYTTTKRGQQAYAAWKERGYMNAPHELTEDELDNIKLYSNLEPPPNGFGTGPTHTNPLQIKICEYAGQSIWVYDSRGFLFSTNNWQTVYLAARYNAHGEEPLRRLLYPDEFNERKERLAAAAAKAIRMVERAQARPSLTDPSGTNVAQHVGNDGLPVGGADLAKLLGL